jgi:ApbE family
VVDRAVDVFARVERACTRFNPTSPLTLANADPKAWHEVPPKLFNAVREAAHAHLTTAGLFDPRVLRVLESLGYDRSLPFAGGPVTTPAAQPSEQPCGRLAQSVPAAARAAYAAAASVAKARTSSDVLPYRRGAATTTLMRLRLRCSSALSSTSRRRAGHR